MSAPSFSPAAENFLSDLAKEPWVVNWAGMIRHARKKCCPLKFAAEPNNALPSATCDPDEVVDRLNLSRVDGWDIVNAADNDGDPLRPALLRLLKVGV